jgi:CHAT domain-containing protein
MGLEMPSANQEALVAELLACRADQRLTWIATHRASLSLDSIEAIKQQSDPQILTAPGLADALTRCAMLIADALPDTPLAFALAAWARGNWQAYHDPASAIQSYQHAIAGYRGANHSLSVARLLINLVFVYCDCGRFLQAETAYDDARFLLAPMGDVARPYLLRLEQNYGWLLHNQAKYAQALVAHERALTLARQVDQPIVVAEVQVNRALTLGMLGRLAEGEAALLAERTAALTHGQALTVARIDLNVGELYTAQGRPAEALRRLQAARTQFLALNNLMEVGTALICEAALFERIGALREARRNYAQAYHQFIQLGMLPAAGEALVRGAVMRRRSGEFAEAGRLLAQAEQLWTDLDQPHWLALIHFERVAMALAGQDSTTALAWLRSAPLVTGNLAVAVRHRLLLADLQALRWRETGRKPKQTRARRAYERALRLAQETGDRWVEREALAGLGRFVLSAAPALGRGYLEAAAEIDDKIRHLLTVEELKACFHVQTSELLPLLAQCACEQGQPLAALRYAWRAKGSALLDLLEMAGARPAHDADQQTTDQLRQELATLRWRVALEAQDEPESQRERATPAIRVLEERLYEIRRRREAAPGDVAQDWRANPLDLLHEMDADVLIEYLRCGDTLLAIRADRGGDCRAVVLGDMTTILDLWDELQLTMQQVLVLPSERRAESRDLWEESQSLLEQTYMLLMAPLGEFPDDARLLIAPCDGLYMFPFGACHDGIRYVIERCEIQLTPCGVLQAVPPRDGVASGPPVVIAASAEGRLASVAAEAAGIQASLPEATCLVDDPGALDVLFNLATPPRLLHIAAHSILREDAPIFSALRLAGGLLSVEQCYGLALTGTELVVLSGCATASGLDSGGALLAFQSALFVAGARQVVSSLWPIDDVATVEWMASFYQQLAAGLPPATALRYTQRALLASSQHRHPVFWAAFAISRR